MKNNIDILISDRTLSIDNCYSFVLDETSGGINTFIGTIRNHNRGSEVAFLEFDTYDPMAVSEMEKIAKECLEKYDITKIAIHHRKGKVEIKDIAVVIAVSSVHRDASFNACRYAIDTLKEKVPIWKKEFLIDGSYWINAHP